MYSKYFIDSDEIVCSNTSSSSPSALFNVFCSHPSSNEVTTMPNVQPINASSSCDVQTNDDTFHFDVRLLDGDDENDSTHSMFLFVPKWAISTLIYAVDFLASPSTQ